MYVYDWMCNRREYKAEKLRQEERQELRQGIAQVFADDKDAMEKDRSIFQWHHANRPEMSGKARSADT